MFNIVLGFPTPGVEDYHNLFGSSSREEVVEIAGYGEKKLSTVLITGSLHCEADNHHPDAWPIPGALVAVNCESHASERKGKSMVAKGVTDEFGDFMVDLPSYLHAIPNLEKICRVKVRRIPKGLRCRPARHIKKHNGLFKLSTIGNGIRTYDAGNIKIQHSASEPTTTKQ
ncbi:hypothetical protein TSUD_203770 [Trifolium subterraneum]|uniref:Pollen Ole e 1 allergen and extensin family protein n=1 Tax=Trifolium subterraneum TaxID=3900 RepID=A0A2Z6LLR6_TRISU|nr:hypothetical protein TSUD_203770 [Trifolium subterraneum]